MRNLGARATTVDPVSEKPIEVVVRNRAGTATVAAVLAGLLRPRDVVLLIGGLGAGKTAFVQDLCDALGTDEPATSPTFNLVHHYDAGSIEVCHVDLYRVERMAELDDLGLEDVQDAGAVLVVEWGDLAGGALGAALSVSIDDLGDTARRITLTHDGSLWSSRWWALERDLGRVT